MNCLLDPARRPQPGNHLSATITGFWHSKGSTDYGYPSIIARN